MTKFKGFEKATYTQIPNHIIDHIMAELSGNEFKVLIYIARRTLGFHKGIDHISLKQLIEGITTRSGKILDKGTGLSKTTVCKCLNSLEEQGYIVRTRREDNFDGDLPTSFELKLKSTED